MGVSSFCGCLSLKTGALIIGILHVGCPVVLKFCLDVPYCAYEFWTLFCVMLTGFSLLFIVGVITRSVDGVFPFICMHAMIIVVLIYHIVMQLIANIDVIFQSKDEATIMLCKIIGGSLMYYFFIVAHTFYQELLREKFTSLSSIQNTVKCDGVLSDGGILKNHMNQQTMEKNSNKEVPIQCCEESKKSII